MKRGRRQGRLKKRCVKTTSGIGQAWSSPDHKGQWKTDKNGGKWLRSHLRCPIDPRGSGIGEVEVDIFRHVQEKVSSSRLKCIHSFFLRFLYFLTRSLYRTHSLTTPPTHSLIHALNNPTRRKPGAIGKQNAPFSKQLQEHLYSVRKIPRASNYRCSLLLMTAAYSAAEQGSRHSHGRDVSWKTTGKPMR